LVQNESQRARLLQAEAWYGRTLAERVISALEQNNMQGMYAETGEEALQRTLELVPKGSSVGLGGSLTLDQIGAVEALRKGDYHLIDTRNPGLSEAERDKLDKQALVSDVYLTSTNAVTLDGKLVNVDGQGNRVAAMIFGPSRIIVVAGVNKIVPTQEAALQRIKDYVGPIHARRRDRPLPCAKSGKCSDCRAPLRFCNVTGIIENQRKKDRITVIICGERLGI